MTQSNVISTEKYQRIVTSIAISITKYQSTSISFVKYQSIAISIAKY